MCKKDENTIIMRQPYLIERLIQDIGLGDSNTQDLPAVSPFLNKDPEGTARQSNWNYRSVIRMLNYIAN